MAHSPRKLRLIVPRELAGARLDQCLARMDERFSRSSWKERIESGAVRIGGEVSARASRSVEAGDAIEVELADVRSATTADLTGLALAVLYEDAHLAMIDKPAGMLAHPGPRTSGPSVSALAALRWKDLPSLQGVDRPGIVHRLDAGTSGLMVLGLDEPTLAALIEAFRSRAVEKTYLALVHGEPRFDSDWIEAPVGRSAERPDRQRVLPAGEGRAASTFYEVRERFRGFALLACKPKTGRTHQIRVHLAHADMPIVGDRLYRRRGPHKIELPAEAPAMERQALHAAELAFAHPATGAALRFESPLPADMRALLDWLRGH